MTPRLGPALAMAVAFAGGAQGADFQPDVPSAPPAAPAISTIEGRASAMSGDTLWFPDPGLNVRLAGIRACGLPQWAFYPSKERGPHLAPVPCGPIAKAWMKRTIGAGVVSCHIVSPVDLAARCAVRGRDLGLEMLRVGWALVSDAGAATPYLAAERYARSARYGLWGTYVLDPDEWQMRAVDRTLARRPVADRNLLKDRHSEVTPPFADWRNRPVRSDR